MSESLQGIVIQIDVGNFDILMIQRVAIHGKTVILGCDLDSSGLKAFDRLIGTPVTEFQFIRFCA